MSKLTTLECPLLGGEGLYVPQRQPAGGAIGPFSNANYWAGVAGEGYDFVPGRCFLNKIYRAGAANNQTVIAFSTAASGFFMVHGSSRNLALFWRGAGGSSTTLTPNFYFGTHTIALGMMPDSSLGFALDGGPFTPLADPGLYTVGGAAAIFSVGKTQGEGTFAATQSRVIANAIIDKADLSAADLELWSSSTNTLDRWHLHPEALAQAGLLCLFNWEDWDGVSATFDGVGSSPITLTRAGTGGGKVTLPAYLRYRIPRQAEHDNGYWENAGGGRIRHSMFAEAVFTSDAADLDATGPAGVCVDLYTTTGGIVANANAGLSVNGTNLPANNVGVEADAFGVLRAIDCPGIVAGAGKTFVVTDGLQSENYPDATDIQIVGPQFIRVPESQPLTWVEKTPPADVIVVMGDSLIGEVIGITDVAGLKGPPYQAWTMLMRANWAGRRIVCDGWGFGQWFERIATDDQLNAFVAQMQRVAIGTVSNILWWPLGTNDYGLATFANLATFEARLTLAINAVVALGLPGLQLYVVSPTARLNEATNNANGWNLPGLRTSEDNVVTAIGDPSVVYVDASGFVSVANRPDGLQLHYNPAGHIEYEAAARVVLGY